MTRSPEFHYERADALLAELELADPAVAVKLPHVRHKMILAELHARLASCTYYQAHDRT